MGAGATGSAKVLGSAAVALRDSNVRGRELDRPPLVPWAWVVLT